MTTTFLAALALLTSGSVAGATKPPAAQAESLDGTWQVARLPLGADGVPGLGQVFRGGAKTILAAVPGEIHLDLMRAGEMKDPSVGANSRKDRWPERYSWWYRTTFTPPAGFTAQERQELVFDGLLYSAELFLNGKLIGTSQNGLVPIRFDVTGMLKPGENDLVVRLTSGYELIGEVDQDFSAKGLYANRENFPARVKLRSPALHVGVGLERHAAEHRHLAERAPRGPQPRGVGPGSARHRDRRRQSVAEGRRDDRQPSAMGAHAVHARHRVDAAERTADCPAAGAQPRHRNQPRSVRNTGARSQAVVAERHGRPASVHVESLAFV